MSSHKIIVNGILRHGSEVLIARRSMTKKIAPGKYHLPGGHVKFAETPEAAIMREFAEEFGIAIKVGQVIGTFSYMIDDIHTVGICFLLSFDGDISTITIDPDDNDEIRWIAAAELKDYFEPSDHNYTLLERYFSVQNKSKITAAPMIAN